MRTSILFGILLILGTRCWASVNIIMTRDARNRTELRKPWLCSTRFRLVSALATPSRLKISDISRINTGAERSEPVKTEAKPIKPRVFLRYLTIYFGIILTNSRWVRDQNER